MYERYKRAINRCWSQLIGLLFSFIRALFLIYLRNGDHFKQIFNYVSIALLFVVNLITNNSLTLRVIKQAFH